ncbi:MAG: hypothetical protein Q7S33_05770 [Nanoarchaeota archaeon]|nr:hypothetical protein [Nanoarchaeota archaeon]
MNKNLILIGVISVFALFAIASVSALDWSWLTGKATADTNPTVGPFKLSEGKSTTVNVGGSKQIIQLSIVADSDTAVIIVGGEQKTITTGYNYLIGNVEINIKSIGYSAKTSVFSKNYITFTLKKSEVSSSGSSGGNGNEEVIINESNPLSKVYFLGAYKKAELPSNLENPLIYRTILSNNGGGATITYIGSSWTCTTVVYPMDGQDDIPQTFSQTFVNLDAGGKPLNAQIIGICNKYVPQAIKGGTCVYIEKSDCTGKPEFILVTSDELNTAKITNNVAKTNGNSGEFNTFMQNNAGNMQNVNTHTYYWKFKTQ